MKTSEIETATDLQLLARYARDRAEDAFAELVRRHLGLVHSAALRQVGSPQLAEEVAQSVFTDLARNAAKLRPGVGVASALSAWLYQVTRRTAIDVVRREARRQWREQIATDLNAMNATTNDWAHIEPLLDDAMDALDATDRTAVLLRYFENMSLREVGATLGTSDDAAQKRVSRAVERLREFFAQRGVRIGTSGLVVVISAHAVQAAPVGLAVTISTAAVLAATTMTTSVTSTTITTIAMTTLQKAVLVATLVAVVGTGIYQVREVSILRRRVEALQLAQAPLVEQNAQLKSDNESLANRLAQADKLSYVSSDRLRELLRLRGEVGVLRRQQRESERVAAAQAKTAEVTGRPAAGATLPPNQPLPFQVQLVLDQPGEDAELMTNSASGDGGETLYVGKTPLLDYTAISSATVVRNPASGAAEISVEFSPEGRELFAAVTKENINKRLAIVLDGHLYSAPRIRSEITGGKAQITGSFTDAEASELAAKINELVGSR